MEVLSPAMIDRIVIRELLDNWILYRDGGDWERFATLWHPDGWMITTWFQASARDFIARSREAWADGMKVYHSQGGMTVDIRGKRAVAQTKMKIMQRSAIDGVPVDVICYGRFWDALEKIDGCWLLRLRQPIYELDHIVALDPNRALVLDPAKLAAFPEGYRHLAYLQAGLGFEVKTDLPGTRGPEIEALMTRGTLWLDGNLPDCLMTPPIPPMDAS